MWLRHQSLVYFGCFFLLLSTCSQQEEANGLLTLVKREKMEGDDCNLDLKVEVNIHSECGLSAGECVSRTGLSPRFSIKKLAGLEEVSKVPVCLCPSRSGAQ